MRRVQGSTTNILSQIENQVNLSGKSYRTKDLTYFFFFFSFFIGFFYFIYYNYNILELGLDEWDMSRLGLELRLLLLLHVTWPLLFIGVT